MKTGTIQKLKKKLKKLKNHLFSIESNFLSGILIILWGFVILWLLGITYNYIFISLKRILGLWLFVSQLFALHKLLSSGDR